MSDKLQEYLDVPKQFIKEGNQVAPNCPPSRFTPRSLAPLLILVHQPMHKAHTKR